MAVLTPKLGIVEMEMGSFSLSRDLRETRDYMVI